MNSQYFNILLFAAIALFLLFRLRSVLGRKTGTERPPAFTGNMAPRAPLRPEARAGNGGGQVIDLVPNRPTDPLQAGLAAIAAADPKFSPPSFLPGAAKAFEMIVKAHAENDTAMLRRLLSDEVYDAFAETIRARLAAKQTTETRILKLAPPEIVSASFDNRIAAVTVKFASSQIHAVRDAEGRIVEGDAEKPIDIVDLWTFSRNVRSLDPNWVLTATDTHE